MKISRICRYCGGKVELVPARRIYGEAVKRLGLEDESIYRALLNHLKDKEPAYYYTDVLVPNGKTLKDFIR